jgi:hypothetical protein
VSKLADKVYGLLKEMFPHNIILKEHYVNYKGTRLFFDFCIKDLNFFLFEIQGIQHEKFVGHFYLDRQGLVNQKHRDNLKLEYVESEPKISFVRINYNEQINRKLILDKMIKALTDKSGICL